MNPVLYWYPRRSRGIGPEKLDRTYIPCVHVTNAVGNIVVAVVASYLTHQGLTKNKS